MTHGRTIALLVALVAAGCIAPGAGIETQSAEGATDAAPPATLATLVPGEPLALAAGAPVYWTGPYIAAANLGASFSGMATGFALRALCDAHPARPCIEYAIEAPEGAAMLRVALDHPDFGDQFVLGLYDPQGEQVAFDGARYSLETRASSPEPGTWTALVAPVDVRDTPFRMRAVVDAEEPEPATGLPNLVPVVPFDFRFDMPVGVGTGHAVPAGVSPASCLVEEMALAMAPVHRCLRFSFGYSDASATPFVMRLKVDTVPSLDVPIVQVLTDASGAEEERDAGTARWHAAHGHYHYDGVFYAELMRVEDGNVTPGVLAAKRGSCTGDVVLADWYNASNGRAFSAGSNCGAGLIPGRIRAEEIGLEYGTISLSPGWGDVYPWDISDNYVDVEGVPDGEYVFRAAIDPEDRILESDESDNECYVHLVLNGSSVQVIERGYGHDPWDPAKRVIEAPWVT